MRVAMFGGSFNPVHSGHVRLAEVFVQRLGLAKIIIVPAFVSPFKQSDHTVTPQQRLEMCRLAFEHMPQAEVSDVEMKREGTSYTYMTLEQLAQDYPADELFLITGADMFLSIHTWKNSQTIFRLATICGLPRNDDDVAALQKQADHLQTLGARTVILDAGVMTVSSTQIRSYLRSGKNIAALVPPQVEQYIKQHKLYK